MLRVYWVVIQETLLHFENILSDFASTWYIYPDWSVHRLRANSSRTIMHIRYLLKPLDHLMIAAAIIPLYHISIAWNVVAWILFFSHIL